MVLHSGGPVVGAGGTVDAGGFGPSAQVAVTRLPARWKGVQQAGAGLTNLGNTCYLNSTLQCLAYLPPLAALCLARAHSATCPRSTPATLPRPAALPHPPCVACMLERQLAAQLRGGRGSSVSPAEVVRHLGGLSRAFVPGRQEDAAELLTALLDCCERDARKAAVAAGAPQRCRTWVEDLFAGCWQSQVRCLACGHESNSYQSFVSLPLDIGQARSVLDGLRAFTEAERLDGSNRYRCDRCRQLVPARKQTTVWDEPNVLVLHIKRFDACCLGKVSRHVAFPEALDLASFLTPAEERARAERGAREAAKEAGSAVAGPQGQGANGQNGHHQHEHHQHHHHSHHHQHQDEHHANGNGVSHQHYDHQHHHHPHDGTAAAAANGAAPAAVRGTPSYALTGVLVHQGSSLHSGHYYAVVRDSSDRWACMNDSSVYGTTLEQVRQEQAYMLFYVRTTMKASRPVPPPTPTPPPAAGAAARPVAAPAGPAPPPSRTVYGPQLPPNMTRGSVGAAAAAAEGPALPVPRPARPPGVAVPSARLPPKVPTPSAAAGAAAAAPAGAPAAQRRPVIGPSLPPADGRPRAASLPGRPSLDVPAPAPPATAAAPTSPAPGHKRRRSEGGDAAPSAAAAGPADTTATDTSETAAAGSSVRQAVEDELAAHKAGASWRNGVKRLKTSLTDKLRACPEWLGQAREAVRVMRDAGASLAEVLATPQRDPAKRRLQRAVPRQVLAAGQGELGRLLKSLLPLFLVIGLVP